MELLSFVISRLCCSLEVLRTPHSSNCLTGRRQEPGQSPITCQLAANQACRLLSSHHVNTVAIFLGLSDWLSQGKMLVWIIYPAQPGGLASGTTRGSDHWGSVAELSDYSRTISKQWVLDWRGQGTHLLQGRSFSSPASCGWTGETSHVFITKLTLYVMLGGRLLSSNYQVILQWISLAVWSSER